MHANPTPADTPSTPIVLLDMESRLLADADGSYRRELDATLESLEREMLTRLRRMAPPEDHERYRRLADGVAAARIVAATCCRTAPS